MFIAALLLFGFWNVALGSETACRLVAEGECPFLLTLVKNISGFPECKKDLEPICQNLYEFKQCVTDSVKKCMESGSDDLSSRIVEESDLLRLKYRQRMIDVATEICQKDSDLHSKVAEHLACFKELADSELKDDSCLRYFRIASAHLRILRDVKVKQILNDELQSKLNKCLDILIDMNCLLRKFNSKCGSRAKDTALGIIQKGGSFEDICPEDIRIYTMELLDAWEKVSETGIFVRKLILSDI